MGTRINVRRYSTYPAAYAALLALLTGCTYNVAIEPFDTRPLLKKRNITAGVYYSNELRDSMHIVKPDRGFYKLNFPVGKASIEMLDRVLTDAFDRVVNVENWPVPATSLPEVGLVVEPSLESFSVKQRISDQRETWEAKIEYGIKIFSADGKIVGQHKVLGQGHMAMESFKIHSKRPAVIMAERAIREAATKLNVALDADGEMDTWFRISLQMSQVPSKDESFEQKEQFDSQEMLVAVVRYPVVETTPEVDVTDCVIKNISSENPSVKVMGEGEFREKMFPWLEVSTAPDTAEKMISLLSRPLVRERLHAFHVKYVVAITGGTTQKLKKYLGGARCGGAGNFGYACIGLTIKERESNLAATIFNIRQAEIAGATEASAQGTSWAAGALLLPIWHTAKPDATACEILADKLVAILHGDEEEKNPDSVEAPQDAFK